MDYKVGDKIIIPSLNDAEGEIIEIDEERAPDKYVIRFKDPMFSTCGYSLKDIDKNKKASIEIKDMNNPMDLLRIMIEEKKEIKNKQSIIKQCEDRLTTLFEEGKLGG